MNQRKAKKYRKMAKFVAETNKLPYAEYQRNSVGNVRLIENCFRRIYQKMKRGLVNG